VRRALATRSLHWRALPDLLTEASVTTARVTSIIAGAMGIGWVLALTGIPASIAEIAPGRVFLAVVPYALALAVLLLLIVLLPGICLH
jgi:TRAP-type C4-dicarboxylate transport system permease large subunit